MIISILRVVFGVVGVVFAGVLARDIIRTHKKGELTEKVSPIKSAIIGFVANFLDAIGVGSYAVAVSLNRVLKQFPVRLLPGTLTVGIGLLPTMIETVVGMSVIQVDGATVLMFAIVSAIGGWFGAKVIAHFSEKKVLMVVGPILFIVGIIMVIKVYGAYNSVSGSESLDGTFGLSGKYFIIGIVGAFIIGGLQAWGLGYFAPTMALLAMLGMNARSMYPVMYTGAGAGMAASANKFIQEGAYARKFSIFASIAGIVGVSLSLWLIHSIDLRVLNALVALILLYIGAEMFTRGIKKKEDN